MKISRVEIKNYRSLSAVEIDVDDYSALVGANGAGKSSVLYALDWFFNGRILDRSDVHGYRIGETEEMECFIEVCVTFRDLSARDRQQLGMFGRGAISVLRKTWRPGQQDRFSGLSLQGPGFANVRDIGKIGDFRKAYRDLSSTIDGLPNLGSTVARDSIEAALASWEAQPANSSKLEALEVDASAILGQKGANALNQMIRLVLVPAATDISSQVGDSGGKGSALNSLIGAVMGEAGARATAQWLASNEASIASLQREVIESVAASTNLQAARVNARLSNLIPNAAIKLTPSTPNWLPKASPSVTTDVVIDGVANDISRQGHGVQRAVMISMFEALVPDEALAKEGHEPLDGESEQDAAARLAEQLAELPNLIVCIEEPEIYQHPVRARTFARTLSELSRQHNAQVLVATHSPYFIRPDQFSSLRRFTLRSGVTEVASTNPTAIEAATGIDASNISKIVDKRVPTEFSEGFFAGAVVLVEGDTDRAVLEAVASKIGHDLDALGVSVIEVSSKESLRIPYEILTALGVPTYVVVDADFGGADRKHPSDPSKRDEVHASHRISTESVKAWIPGEDGILGSGSFQFGDATTITSKAAFWFDDLEEELSQWPSFMSALAQQSGSLRVRKNLYSYRQAAAYADSADIPETLRAAIKAISEFAS